RSPECNHIVSVGRWTQVCIVFQLVYNAVTLCYPTPLLKPETVVRSRLVPEGKAEPRAVVPLRPSQNQGRLWEGQATDLPAGTYRIQLDIPDLKAQLAAPDAEDTKNPRRDTVVVLP